MDRDFILNQVCPVVGVILSTCQLSSSVKVILQAKRDQNLGTINPYPLVVSLVCCISWFLYGLLLGNVYYVLSVFIGTMVNTMSYSTAVNLLGLHNRQVAAANIEKFLLVCLFWYLLVGLLTSVKIFDSHRALVIVGYSALASSLIYYLAPLSSLLEIVQTKNSSSLYYPSVILNMITSGMWFAYGVSLGDLNLIIPMAYGLILSIIQLCVKMRYGGDGCCPKVNKVNSGDNASMRSDCYEESTVGSAGRRKNVDQWQSQSDSDGWVNEERGSTAPTSPPDSTRVNEFRYDSEVDEVGQHSPVLVAGGGDAQTLSVVTTPWETSVPGGGLTAMNMASAGQMMSDDVPHHHESITGAMVGALAGVLAPFKTQISMRTIEAIEDHGNHSHAPNISDEPVTIVGAVTEYIGTLLPTMGVVTEETADDVGQAPSPRVLPFSLDMPSLRVTRNESGSGYIQLDSVRSDPTKEEVVGSLEEVRSGNNTSEKSRDDLGDSFV